MSKNPSVTETTKKILIIEDDEALVKMYSLKFQHEGFDIDYALNGEVGLNKLQKKEYDLILLDLMLPKINGFQVLETLRKSNFINKNKMVIAITNLSLYEDRKKVSDLGANGYVIKANLTPREIVEKIKGYLADPNLAAKILSQ